MKRARVIVLSFPGGGELVCSLKRILEASSLCDFEMAEIVLHVDGLRRPSALFEFPRNSGNPADLVLVCLPAEALRLPPNAILQIFEKLRSAPIVLIAEAVEAQPLQNLFESEVADFILTPLRAIDVIPRLLRLLQHVGKSESLWGHLKEQLGLRQFVGESSLLLQEIRKIPKLAQCDVSILIGGETGTGKEMFARAIHYLSPRSDKPFIPVNCGALPAELVENELFGHAEGAFTGATSSAAGLISESDGGTMFLDEIDALPLPSQAKLLRFVQEKEFRPLGSCKTRKADVRVLAASNIKFEEAVRSGRFRADLYYRLNVIPISLPALRHRKEDIPPLVRHLLTKYASELRKPLPALSRLAMQKLMSYDWPGNVRELENTIERALILSDHPTIGCEDILLPSTLAATPDTSFKSLKAKVIADFEYKYIRELLLAYDGNITRAATAAKKNRRAFWQLMKKHDITVPSAAFS